MYKDRLWRSSAGLPQTVCVTIITKLFCQSQQMPHNGEAIAGL